MKPVVLHDANGLVLSPLETLRLYQVLFAVFEQNVTPADRLFAKELLLKSALTYPEYAHIKQPRRNDWSFVRADLRTRPGNAHRRKKKGGRR